MTSTSETKGGRTAPKPRLAVYKFSSCDGCQLQILNLEERLLELVQVVEVAYFLEARRQQLPPPYDIGLVEGSISTPEEEERIQQARKDCKVLIAIGACATSGGIQALRNWGDVAEMTRQVYASPEYIETLDTATPIAAHVFVDFELRGCPVTPDHIVELVTAYLAGRRPHIPTYSVCVECKRRGLSCVLVARGEPCLGPITQAGCGALCPSCHRACYGCFGPSEQPNIDSLGNWFTTRLDKSPVEMKRMLRSFNGFLEPFRQASNHYEELERRQKETE